MNQSAALQQALLHAAAASPTLETLVAETVEESRHITHLSDSNSLFPAETQTVLSHALSALAEAEAEMAQLQERIRVLENKLMHDELTGLLNRQGLQHEYARENSHLTRGHSCGFTLVMFDLDEFKLINDTHGHLAGDAALRTVGDFFHRTVRKTDAIARIGGDEFALLLTNIDNGTARYRAGAIADGLNSLSYEWNGQVISIRSSHGTAHAAAPEPLESVYGRADESLYASKARRRY